MKILSITCEDFKSEGTVYVPSETGIKYQHTVTLDVNINAPVNVYIVNEQPFVRLPQEVSQVPNTKIITFYTSLHSFENASTDILEIVVGTDVLREYLDIQKVKISKTLMTKQLGHKPLLLSNLLYPRIKLGFATWSSVEKNQISTTTKFLEPLLSPLYDSYFKMQSLTTNRKYNIAYPKTYEIYTGQKPTSVIKLDTQQKLHPVSSNERAPVRLSTTKSSSREDHISILIDPASPLPNLDKLENQILYIKKSDNFQSDLYFIVKLKGYNESGDYIEETLRVRQDIYTMTTRSFVKLSDVGTDCPIVITNTVDCRYNHYILRDTMLPPIVDESLMQFLPTFQLKTHGEEDEFYHLDVLRIVGNQPNIVYQFGFETLEKPLSYFVDQNLRITWNTDNGSLCSSVLGHDLSKDVGSHPSVNNNDIISITNMNTLVGDWAEATICPGNWTSKEPMIISIKNKDTILYYNQETEEFSEGVSYYYSSTEDSDFTLSVKVSNDSPYIFTVMSPTLTEKYLAVSYSHTLYDYSVGSTTTGNYLIHKGGKLKVATLRREGVVTSEDFNMVMIAKESTENFDWQCNIEGTGYYLGTNGSNLPEELYNIYQYTGTSDFPVSFRLDYDGILNLVNKEQITIQVEGGDILWYKNSYKKDGTLTYTINRGELNES